MTAARCPKCQRDLTVGKNSCCGKTINVIPNGEIGFQMQLSPRSEKPAFVVKGGELKRG